MELHERSGACLHFAQRGAGAMRRLGRVAGSAPCTSGRMTDAGSPDAAGCVAGMLHCGSLGVVIKTFTGAELLEHSGQDLISMLLWAVIRSLPHGLACARAATAWLVLCPVIALAHGDVHDRIKSLTLELTEEADNAKLWVKRADLNRRHGEFAAALSDADEALRLKPDWPAAQLQRARILLDVQRYPSACAAANACLARDPANSDALVIRSRCHAHLGDTNAAIRDLSIALRGEQSSLPDLYLERARLQAALGLLNDAVKGLDEGMARLGETPSLAFPALNYERQSGDFEAALARLAELERFMTRERYQALKATLVTGIDESTAPTTDPGSVQTSAP